MAPQRRVRVLTTQVVAGAADYPSHFSGTDVPVGPGYKVEIPAIPAGIRESIRDIKGEPTNCDHCKPWIGDIAAQAAKGGMKPYAWFAPKEAPAFVPVSKPLSQCKVGMISTSGCYAVGDKAYTYKDDQTTKMIPIGTPVSDLRFSHFTENYLSDGRQDPSCIFPIETLRRLQKDGVIGSLPENVFSCMGANYSTKGTIENVGPSVAKMFKEQNIDVALVVPMCPLCHQTASIVARTVEAAGIPTMVMGSAFDILSSCWAPRVSFVNYPLGHQAGKPNDPADQYRLVKAALEGFQTHTKPGQVNVLPCNWGDSIDHCDTVGGAKEAVRQKRDTVLRYQSQQDMDAAVAKFGDSAKGVISAEAVRQNDYFAKGGK